jgi:hypothetical protein
VRFEEPGGGFQRRDVQELRERCASKAVLVADEDVRWAAAAVAQDRLKADYVVSF